MNGSEPDPLDWAQLQALLSVVRAGSLSAAARQGGLSQPTLSRRLAALERRLGAVLLERGPGGATLTDAGREAAAQAEAMETAAARLALAVGARDGGLAGTVRIAASRVVGAWLLPPILAALMKDEPRLEVELAPSDDAANLLRREADLAVRMFRPVQEDLIARHLGDLPMGLFATPGYLERHGAPARLQDVMQHRVIGYDHSPLIRDGFARAGHPVSRRFFALRTDDQVAYWELVAAGAGLGVYPIPIGDADPRVRRALPGPPLASLPVWLVAHAELRASERVRRVWDAVADGLARLCRTGPPERRDA